MRFVSQRNARAAEDQKISFLTNTRRDLRALVKAARMPTGRAISAKSLLRNVNVCDTSPVDHAVIAG